MVDKKTDFVLIVGGGIAGLTAARELNSMGITILVIEKSPFIGGHAVNITCKATDRCIKCNDCLVEGILRDISVNEGLCIRTRTTLTDVEKIGNRFSASFSSDPQLIDPEKCTNCGLCYEKCPGVERGAIIKAPSPNINPSYAIDPSKCDHCRDKKSRICQAVCPEHAIELDGEKESWSKEVDGIVLATGYEPFDPEEVARYKYSGFSNMITGMDLEKTLRSEGSIVRTSDGVKPEKMAFVQCVGSRDSRLGHEFCSRVCCGYALRMGLRLVYDNPEIDITVFYMDIQNFGKDFDRYFQEAKDHMRFLRGLPGDFYQGDNDNISVNYYNEDSGRTISEDFDMVVLSVGLMPGSSNNFFAETLDLNVNEDGFLEIKEKMRYKGIVVAGTTEGPMDVSESISHAKRAAFDMSKFLGTVSK